MPRKRTVTIKLVKNASKGTYRLSINPLDMWIKSSGYTVHWKCSGASVKVDFDKGQGTPFTSNSFTDTPSGEPKNTVVQGVYGYTITLTPTNPIPLGNYGTIREIKIDPQIVIDDSPDPGGGRRRRGGGKKKAARRGGAKKRATRRGRKR